MKTNKIFIPIAVALGTSASLHAAATVYEPFDQTAGALNGQASSGVGLTGNWSDDQTVDVVTPGTMSYGNLQNAGGQAVLGNGNSTDAWVTTSTTLGNANLLEDGATLWFSYMFEAGSGGGGNQWAGFAFGTERLDASFSGANMINSGNGIGLTSRDKTLRASTWTGGGNANQEGTLTFGGLDPYPVSTLVVGKIEWGTGGADEMFTLYSVDPSDLGTLGTGVTASMSDVTQSAFDTISFTKRNSGGTATYDEIRFGATLADVTPVPEPSSMALLGLGGLALLRRRRK
jgi:hypothetical protein